MKAKIIDTDILPQLPEWATLVENKTYGKLKFDVSKMGLYLSEKQKDRYIVGNDLREEMNDKNPVNLAVLQFFVENPKLFPKEWKGKYIYAWGTIVTRRSGYLHVPCACERDGRVVVDWHWLGIAWYANYPALRFASIDAGNSEVSSLEPKNLDLKKKLNDIEAKLERIKELL